MTDLLPAVPDAQPIEPSAVIPGPPAVPHKSIAEPVLLVSARTVDDLTQVPDLTVAPEPEWEQRDRNRRVRERSWPRWALTDDEPPPEPRPQGPKPEPAAHDKTRRARRQRRIRVARVAESTPEAPACPEEIAEPPVEEPSEPQGRERRFSLYPRRRRLSAPDHRTRRQRRSDRLKNLATLSLGAGIGWQCYLGPAYTGIIHTIGQASPKWAVGFGLVMVFGGLVIDDNLRQGVSVGDATVLGLAYITVARVPLGTALLALALYAPGTL
ncbi:hypothetical protein GCM10010193_70300 [Kitasatospora atroaurantiaca]|uniref:Uncharacterized protein n=1 Tax=Kitasatospora atroaurantiaca TaxID=285545 RepID=A0A561END1_9ACTN|nr:hypothetical protein [Kitasatospora atroaurantiaca]TWE17117.1 hypothetical protein FB465_2122 [Kitasatospora atroaurantiaca]